MSEVKLKKSNKKPSLGFMLRLEDLSFTVTFNIWKKWADIVKIC